MSIFSVLRGVIAWLFFGLLIALVVTFAAFAVEFIYGDVGAAYLADFFKDEFVQAFLLSYMASAVLVSAVLLVFSVIFYIAGLGKRHFFISSFLKFSGVNLLPAIILGVSYNSFVIEQLGYLDFPDIPIGIVLLSIAGVFVGVYIVNIALGYIGAFLGASFEHLANAQPKGRGMLFSEALSLGYTKQQTRVFINDLNMGTDSGGGLYFYTTLILYGLPIFAAIVVIFDV